MKEKKKFAIVIFLLFSVIVSIINSIAFIADPWGIIPEKTIWSELRYVSGLCIWLWPFLIILKIRHRDTKAQGLDGEYNFLQLPVVHYTCCIVVWLSICFSINIFYESDLHPSGSFNGFNYFLTVFRFPIAFLALLFPILTVIAVQHRSVLTTKQIAASNDQNLFNNYFTHIERFEDHCEAYTVIPEVEESGKYLSSFSQVTSPRELHSKLFPSLRKDGDIHIGNLTELQISEFSKSIMIIIKKIWDSAKAQDNRVPYTMLITLFDCLQSLEEYLYIRWIPGNDCPTKFSFNAHTNRGVTYVLDDDMWIPITILKYRINYLNDILKFAPQFSTLSIMLFTLNFDFENWDSIQIAYEM